MSTSGRLLAGRVDRIGEVMAEMNHAVTKICPPVRAQHMQLRDEPR